MPYSDIAKRREMVKRWKEKNREKVKAQKKRYRARTQEKKRNGTKKQGKKMKENRPNDGLRVKVTPLKGHTFEEALHRLENRIKREIDSSRRNEEKVAGKNRDSYGVQ